MPCHSRGPGTLIVEPQDKYIAGIHRRTLDFSPKINSLPIRTTLMLPRRQFSTWGQDRLKGGLSSYSGPCDIRKYFHFITAGKTYQFRVLPFSFSAAPREFTKILALLVQLLLHIQQTIQLLQMLGWTFNWKKSILEPSCILDFLGLQSRTSNCFSSRFLLRFSHQCPFPSISVQGHAYMQDNFYKWSVLSLCPVYQSQTPSSQVPTVLDKDAGHNTHSPGTLRSNWIPNFSHIYTGSTDEKFFKESHCISRGPTLLFFTNASLTGLGASWQTSHLSVQWSPPESSQHINWLELEAIRLALLQWWPQFIFHITRTTELGR